MDDSAAGGQHGAAEQAPAFSNRLAHETSPYLKAHAHNPVDWYPWGPDALERARHERKPILLSIGSAACHWCHVMAHESFEDAGTAATASACRVPRTRVPRPSGGLAGREVVTDAR